MSLCPSAREWRPPARRQAGAKRHRAAEAAQTAGNAVNIPTLRRRSPMRAPTIDALGGRERKLGAMLKEDESSQRGTRRPELRDSTGSL